MEARANRRARALPDAELRAVVDLFRPRLAVGIGQERLPGLKVSAAGTEPGADVYADPLPPAAARAWKAMTSGGSTGRPKVIVANRPSILDPSLPPLGMVPGDVILNPGPLYHNAPFSLDVRGGANVYPAEVEAALDARPDIQSSAVISLPDDDLGQRVHAIVQPAPGARDRLGIEALQAFLADRLVRYKLPRSIEFVDGPLRDDADKARRSELKAERVANRV